MRISKTSALKKTVTRRVVKKAIKSQDAEDLLTDHEINEMIRVKAYELFEARGGQGGSPGQDWANAEKIILQKIT